VSIVSFPPQCFLKGVSLVGIFSNHQPFLRGSVIVPFFFFMAAPGSSFIPDSFPPCFFGPFFFLSLSRASYTPLIFPLVSGTIHGRACLVWLFFFFCDCTRCVVFLSFAPCRQFFMNGVFAVFQPSLCLGHRFYVRPLFLCVPISQRPFLSDYDYIAGVVSFFFSLRPPFPPPHALYFRFFFFF